MGCRDGRHTGQWTRQLNPVAWLRAALLLAALAPAGSLAANKLPDSNLLEFLGSLDADGSEWNEYLEGTDLDKVARPTRPAQPEPPPAVPAKPVPPPPPAARQPERAQ